MKQRQIEIFALDGGRWYAACLVIPFYKSGRLCERILGASARRGCVRIVIHQVPMSAEMSPSKELGLLKTAFISTTTSSPMLRPGALQTVVDCARNVGRVMRASGIPAEQAVIEVKRTAHLIGDTENEVGLLDRAVTAVIQGFYEPDDS